MLIRIAIQLKPEIAAKAKSFLELFMPLSFENKYKKTIPEMYAVKSV